MEAQGGGPVKQTQYYPIDRETLQWGDIHGGADTRQRNARIVLSLLQGAPTKRVAAQHKLSYGRVRQIWMLTSIRQHRRLGRELL